MTNIVNNKSLKYTEWIVEIPSDSDCLVSSDMFKIQDGNWNLVFYTGNVKKIPDPEFKDGVLYFHFSKKLISPISMTIRILSASKTLFLETHTITSCYQGVWNCPSALIRGVLLKVEIIIHSDSIEENILPCQPQVDPKFCFESLSQDFERMFNDGTNHDAVIKCNNFNWKVHKNVLSVRSKVLGAMLNSDMIEGRTGVIILQEVDESMVQHFLRYLYCGKLPEMTMEIAKKLYEIGDKYAVECLKKSCANFIKNCLTPENSCEILILADQHNDSTFKESVVDYLIDQKIVLRDDIWQDFCKCYPVIATEVYNRFCKSQCFK